MTEDLERIIIKTHAMIVAVRRYIGLKTQNYMQKRKDAEPAIYCKMEYRIFDQNKRILRNLLSQE